MVVVHAGLMPDVPLEEQQEFVMTQMRNLIPDKHGGWTASGQNETNLMTHHDVAQGMTFKGAREQVMATLDTYSSLSIITKHVPLSPSKVFISFCHLS